MEYANKWNINMNTLNLADYGCSHKVKISGFIVRKNGELATQVFQDDLECIQAWYNLHCMNDTLEISNIQVETVLDTELTGEYWDRLNAQLLRLPVLKKGRYLYLADTEAVSLAIINDTIVMNGLGLGWEEYRLSDDVLKSYGYGLLYWKWEKTFAFFDNRLSKTFQKVQELHEEGVSPLCIRVKKQNKVPIPVQEGRMQVSKFQENEHLKKWYQQIQK